MDRALVQPISTPGEPVPWVDEDLRESGNRCRVVHRLRRVDLVKIVRGVIRGAMPGGQRVNVVSEGQMINYTAIGRKSQVRRDQSPVSRAPQEFLLRWGPFSG